MKPCNGYTSYTQQQHILIYKNYEWKQMSTKRKYRKPHFKLPTTIFQAAEKFILWHQIISHNKSVISSLSSNIATAVLQIFENIKHSVKLGAGKQIYQNLSSHCRSRHRGMDWLGRQIIYYRPTESRRLILQ